MRIGATSLLLLLLLAACGGSAAGPTIPGSVDDDGGPSTSPGPSGSDDGGGLSADAAPPPIGTADASGPPPSNDGGTPPGTDAGDPGTDGTPQRLACTSSFGSALSTSHGRIDGRLVALVPVNQHSCNADSTHLHLQIAMNGGTYDVAVNLDALTAELDAPLPDGAWTEGWHDTMALDYVSNLGLHASGFSPGTVDGIEQHLIAALAQANHVSIFATGYGPGGAHLVHRQGSGRDGAIFIDPLSPKAHGFVFHFSTQTF